MKITQHAESFREKISVMSFITMSACDNPISHCTSIDFGIVLTVKHNGLSLSTAFDIVNTHTPINAH